MIKIRIIKNLLEDRSQWRFLDKVSRDIKSFIMDQFEQFSHVYFKKTNKHEFKITDIPSVSEHSELSNLQNLLLIIKKQDQEKDIEIPRASYHPSLTRIRVFINIKNSINTFDDINKAYIQYMHEGITHLVYHELIHHLQFIDYRKKSSDSVPYASINFPIYRYVANTEGASKEEIQKYEYYSRPEEIETYARDTHFRSRKKRIPFEKALSARIRKAKENIFKSRRGKYLYFVIIYNFLKYAMDRYPSANTDKNKQTLKTFQNFLDENK